jgi:diguanylate cyclase (GGDEF)-like protein
MTSVERNSLLLKKPIGHLSPAGTTQQQTPAPLARPFGAAATLQKTVQPALPDPRVILNSIGEVVYDWEIASDRLTWGANARDVFGIADLAPLSTGQSFAEHQSDDSQTSRFNAIFQSTETDPGSGVRYHIRYGLVLGDDGRGGQTIMRVEDSGRWFAGPDGRPARAHGVLRRIESTGDHTGADSGAPSHDPLTGALSRTAFAEHLGKMFAEAARNQTSFALLLASIDTLPLVNRSFGYDVGDELISGVAKRIASQMRGTDVIGRYTGNKLALALDACDPEQMLVAANRFIHSIASAPFQTSSGPLQTAIRIGGVVSPRHARTTQIMLQRAEEALQTARNQAATRMVAYEPSLARDDSRIRTQMLAEEIVAALNDRRIAIALQPIVDATTGKPAFYESLMRMHLEDGSLVAPSVIFPVAEKVGLVQLLDQRVLELSLERLAAEPDLRLSVNMSSSTAHDPDWPTRAQAAMSRYPGAAERLIIEITESCAIEDVDAARRVIASIKQLGAKVAMDDFGAGHTSFRNLRLLDVDLLKIDGAFVQNVAHSPDDRFFVRTLVDLARHLDIPTVAEWVETEETASLLREWGVNYFQGSHYGQPVEATTVPGADSAAA